METPSDSLCLLLPNEESVRNLATHLAAVLQPFDRIALSGDLGAGKTTFAKWLIRALVGDEGLDVPSPTFSLVQHYTAPKFGILHADLYRIEDAEELDNIGFDELIENNLALVEWPEKAAGYLHLGVDAQFLLHFEYDRSSGGRKVSFQFGKSHEKRLRRFLQRYAFLLQSGWQDAFIKPLMGDASSRSYSRLIRGGLATILMDAPRRPDGPPIRKGKPYSVLAKLAEDVRPFVAVGELLAFIGLHSPQIYAANLEHGFLVLEDFGAQTIAEKGQPVVERYEAAMDVLAHLHRCEISPSVSMKSGALYDIPVFDLEAALTEADLLLEWYWPHRVGVPITARIRDGFSRSWKEVLQPVLEAPKTLVLRDYHSPNLHWIEQEEGIARVGVIDFQDAVMGHCAYDVASICQDARLDMSEELELHLLAHYLKARQAQDPHFDKQSFLSAYATLAAQRATKILGIFVRLSKRDGKHHYLKHLPRIQGYLQRALKHPALLPLAHWYREHGLIE